MNNYKLNAHLIRKPDSSELRAEPCEVVRWIPISKEEFRNILDNPLQDNPTVMAARGLMYSDKNSAHCIMLLEEGGNDGIIVEGEGYDYPRYACFVPNARALYEDHFMTDSERELRNRIKLAAEKALEQVFADGDADINSTALIDEDDMSWLVKGAIIERLNQHPGIKEARCLYPWITEQPDIDIKTEPLKEVKFYCPLKIIQIPEEEDEWYNFCDEPEEISSCDVVRAVMDINLAIEEYASPYEEYRGIMTYLGDREQLGKVYSIFPSVEKIGDYLYGVYTCGIYDDLESYELEALRDELIGQSSDGWGEGFEQKEILTDECGKIYVSFYGASEWSMKTEKEMGIPVTEAQSLDDGDISM
mgnify:CR=1 FL=1